MGTLSVINLMNLVKKKIDTHHFWTTYIGRVYDGPMTDKRIIEMKEAMQEIKFSQVSSLFFLILWTVLGTGSALKLLNVM